MEAIATRILVIGLGWEQARLVDLALATGAEVFGVHAEEEVRRRDDFVEVLQAGPRELPEILAFAERVRPQAVVADQCDYAHFAASVVSAALGLGGVDVGVASGGCNKYLSRTRARAAGLRVPDFELCDGPGAAAQAAARIGFPLIVKPVDNRGSFGVSFVTRSEDLPSAALTALSHSHSRLFLVEQFIEGTNIIIEGYGFPRSGYRALALGSKEVLPHAPHIHLDLVFPGALDEATRQRCLAYNAAAARSQGFVRGMTSAEYVVDGEGQPWLVEMANRGAGVLISSEIVPIVSGVDHTQQLLSDALEEGRDLLEEGAGQEGSAYLGYFVFAPGELASVDGLEAARQLPGVVALRYWGPLSGHIDWPRNALERQGMFITRGASAEEARARARQVRECVEVRYV